MTGGEHLGDRTSALLDGELSAADAAQARAHLEGCAECRAELESLALARRAVRELPRLSPSAELTGAILRRRRFVRDSALALSGTAALLVVVVVATAPEPPAPVRPPVSAMAQQHLGAEVGAPTMVRTISGAPSMTTPQPRTVRAEGEQVTVYVQPGNAARDLDGVRVRVGDRWAVQTSSSPAVVVVPAGGTVLTAIAGDVTAAVRALERVLGGDARTVGDRAHDAAQDLVGAFGLAP